MRGCCGTTHASPSSWDTPRPASLRRGARSVLDPLNPSSHGFLGGALYYGRQYKESIEAFNTVSLSTPKITPPYWLGGLAYYALGRLRARARIV